MSDEEIVLVPAVDRSIIHYHRERVARIPRCGPNSPDYVRRPRSEAAEMAAPCASCFGDELKADGGETTVIVRSTASGQSIRRYHTDLECSAVEQMGESKRRRLRNVPDAAEECQFCTGEAGGEHNPDWTAQNILRNAEPGDLVTDGGTDLITACPECDSPAIKPRNPGKPSSPPSQTTNWYCNDCGAQFDEPTERPRHSEAGGRPGLAGKLARADSEDDLRADGGQAWRPVAGDYSPERGAWLVLYARYAESGWEYCQRVEEPDGTMLRSERGAVAEGEPDLRTDGGRTVADVLAECEARDRIEPLEAVLRGDRDRETLTIEDWTRPVKVTDGAVCLAIPTGVQTIHIGYDGEDFCFTSEIYREGYGGSRPVDDVAEVRALVSRYDPEVVLREATPFESDDADHYCEICERPFESVAALIKHDCDDQEEARLVTDGGIDTDELSAEEIEAVVNTRMFQKALAYRRLADGISVLEDEDQVFESLVNSITNQHSSVTTAGSTREFFRLFREEVETFTEELTDEDEDGGEVGDLRDLVTDEGGDRS